MESPQLGQVGEIAENVAMILGLDIGVGTPIYIGQSNIAHMIARHPADFVKYGCFIHDIIDKPDYVGLNNKDNSLEYVKEFVVNGEYVKVAVRVSSSGKYFVRSVYTLNKNRVKNFIIKGTLKPLTNVQE